MLDEISWSEKKRKQFKENIRRKAIQQDMRKLRKKFVSLDSAELSQFNLSEIKEESDSHWNSVSDCKVDTVMVELEEAIICEKQKLWSQEFLDLLKYFSTFSESRIYEKMYVVLTRMSSCQEEWTYPLFSEFLDIIFQGIEKKYYAVHLLVNCGSCILPHKKYLFYQVFQEKQMANRLLTLGRKDILECLIEIFKNLFSKAPIIIHNLDDELERNKILQSFQIISSIGNQVLEQKAVNYVFLSQILNLFLVLLLRNRKKEKKVILQTCFDAHTYKFFVLLLNNCDKEWDIRIRYKVFHILKQILTEHPEINIQIFYSLAYVMDKFVFQQIESFLVQPEEMDPLFSKICQTYKEFLIIFLSLRFMHKLVGANYLAEKNESQFYNLLYFIFQDCHCLQRSFRRSICSIVDFFLERKSLKGQKYSDFLHTIFTFSLEMLRDETFCLETVQNTLSILTLIMQAYSTPQISCLVSQKFATLEKIVEKLYSEIENPRILKKVQSLENLLATCQNNFVP